MLQRALIVDDSMPLHQLIKTQMDGEGLEFHSAYGGEAALSMAAAIRPSLILLDVDMPDMDGFEVCRRLKANAETTTIPVIFLTADFDTSDKIRGLDMGAVDYVTKPFKPQELSARVRTSLRTRQLLDQKAMIDGLTGLWNRKYLEDHLAQCRAEDAVCHGGGGKFTVLVSGLSRAGAGRLAERLCAQVRRQLLAHGGKDVRVTCSFGVADNLVSGDLTLLERAELALVRAKQNGGSCVSVARPPRKAARADA